MTTFASETPTTAGTVTGWSLTELTGARQALESRISRLRCSLSHSMMSSGPEARRTIADGDDEIYVGTLFAEIAAGSHMADNSYAILAQCEHALHRIDDGTYGLCDACGRSIAKDRLLAMPRATKCTHCSR